jgi:hypothetical protein
MAEYEDDSFEELPEEDSTETSGQIRRSSSIVSPKPNLIVEDEYEEDDYVQDDDDDESWDESKGKANDLRPPVSSTRPQSAVVNGGRPESAPGGSRPPSATLPIHTQRIGALYLIFCVFVEGALFITYWQCSSFLFFANMYEY